MNIHKYSLNVVFLTVFAGTGGEDAKDWAKILLRMYMRFAERKQWKVRVYSESALEIRGEGAFERLRNESGVHRLVRISPFDAKKLRHTSFALVEVLPDVPDVDMQRFMIPEKDLKYEFSRSGGPGGQNVNKVETAVRVIHLPTGVHAASQVERSQAMNRERALRLLKVKLIRVMEERREQELSHLRVRVAPDWGHEIRSYVLHPYQMVKDHRTGFKISHVDDVLEGNLDLLRG